jgi:shikimate kinase
MASRGWIIALEAQPEILLDRLQRQLKDNPAAVRPLLEGSDPLDQIRSLKQTRQSAYRLADWTVHTDTLTQEQVVEEVIRALGILEK